MNKGLTKAERDKLRGEFLGKAARGFDEMFGDDGYNGLVRYRQKEERACEITDVLWKWLMDKHIETDEGIELHRGKECCPQCGEIARPHKGKEGREITGVRGQVEYQREGRYCTGCRIVFFPCGQTNGSGHRGLQSEDSGTD